MITVDTLTAAQVREAQDLNPEKISSERAGHALGFALYHTTGGLPVYPPADWIEDARKSIVIFLNRRAGGQ